MRRTLPTLYPVAMSTSPEARVYVSEGFRWDEQRAYLFDIDGTLMRHRDRVHVDAFFESVRGVMGRELAAGWGDAGGKYRPGDSAGCVPAGEVEDSVWRPHREDVAESDVRACCGAARGAAADDHAGRGERARASEGKGALLGVATGNLEQIGWIKIENAGCGRGSALAGSATALKRGRR